MVSRGQGFIKSLRWLQADRKGSGEGADAVLEGEGYIVGDVYIVSNSNLIEKFIV